MTDKIFLHSCGHELARSVKPGIPIEQQKYYWIERPCSKCYYESDAFGKYIRAESIKTFLRNKRKLEQNGR